jgi:thiol-disulfide isomerase/thioredoxin
LFLAVLALSIISLNLWRVRRPQEKKLLPPPEVKGRIQPSFKVEHLPEAKEIYFEDLNGKSYKLSNFKGNVIILDFQSIHCPACRYEQEFLKYFYEKIKGEPRIKLILLFINSKEDDVRKFVKARDLNLPVYIDPYGLSAMKYRIFALPTSFIINKDFKITHRLIGAQDWSSDEITSFLKKLANE